MVETSSALNDQDILIEMTAHSPQYAGQLAQSVYPTGPQLGGPFKYAFHRHAYHDEGSPLLTEMSKLMLYAEWRR